MQGFVQIFCNLAEGDEHLEEMAVKVLRNGHARLTAAAQAHQSKGTVPMGEAVAPPVSIKLARQRRSIRKGFYKLLYYSLLILFSVVNPSRDKSPCVHGGATVYPT